MPYDFAGNRSHFEMRGYGTGRLSEARGQVERRRNPDEEFAWCVAQRARERIMRLGRRASARAPTVSDEASRGVHLPWRAIGSRLALAVVIRYSLCRYVIDSVARFELLSQAHRKGGSAYSCERRPKGA